MYLKMTKLVCCFVELEMVGDVVVFACACDLVFLLFFGCVFCMYDGMLWAV